MDQRSKIAILGFGIEGKSLLQYLTKHNYHDITVCDRDVNIRAQMPDGVSVRLGPDYLDEITDFEVIFRSPGIPFLTPQIQTVLNRGAEITSMTDFFMKNCPCPVIGVTGTKGKGTTCTLIHNILKKDGRDVYLGGNIGKPPLDFFDHLKGDSIVVMELSSFQLQDLKTSPKYAVLLNTTTDHLDYHVDRAEYMQAKEQLLNNQRETGVAILNKDYEYSKYYTPLVKGALRLVSVKSTVKDGAYVKNDEIFYVKNGKKEKIMKVGEIGLIGSHNLENVMPAVIIGRELGVKTGEISEAVREFQGLPHRLEFAREVKGAKYYNDSFSTTPETSMAAVDSFEVPTILIAGGSDKGLNYDEWAVKILTKESLRTVILMGETAEKMEEAIIEAQGKLGEAEGSPTRVVIRADLDEALLEAYAEAEKGWVVVMSPAAASFDQFSDYKERGEQFKELVSKLR